MITPARAFRERCSRAALALLLFAGTPLEGQDARPAAAHVRWSLVDLVLVPDTCYGVWLLAAPNVGTTSWDRGVQIVQFSVEPVTLLQWASTAQRLVHSPEPGVAADSVRFRTTPRLQSRRGGRFMVLARSIQGVPADERLQLLVVDSATRTRWKTFATTAEVDHLLSTIEEVVARAPGLRPITDSSLVADDQSSDFAPAVQLKAPKPSYPRSLHGKGRSGRVWAEYVVGTDGRVEKGSIRVLLADHEDFARAAVHALERATFRPAIRLGIPVRQRVFQPVSFRLGSR